VKKLICLLLILNTALASECDITDRSNIIESLASGNVNSSLLDDILEQTEVSQRTKVNEQPEVRLTTDEKLSSSQERLTELKANNNSDPVEVYKLQKEIELLKQKAQKEATEKALSDNPNLLDDVLEQTEQAGVRASDDIARTIDNGIELPASVVKELRREGMSDLELTLFSVKKGDSFQAWFRGGEYKRVTIVGKADQDGFVKVEYMEDGKLVTGTKPIEQLALTAKKKKEAEAFHHVSLDEVIENTTNRTMSGRELVQKYVNEHVVNDPKIRAMENEMDKIYREEGVTGMVSERYLKLQANVKEARYPTDPLTGDEIENVFKPLTLLLGKTKLGKGDQELLKKAQELASSKKKYHGSDKEYWDLIDRAKAAPEQNIARQKTAARKSLLDGSSSFRYFRPKFNGSQLAKELAGTRINSSEASDLATALSRDPDEKLSYSERKLVERFLKEAKNSSSEAVEYYRNRLDLYNNYHGY